MISFKKYVLQETINNLKYPYSSDKYYHVTLPENLESIKRKGFESETWVSKEAPWHEYSNGILFEINAEGLKMIPDERWKQEDKIFIITETIPPNRITKIFNWFPELEMREDKLILALMEYSDEEIESFLNKHQIKLGEYFK